MSRTLGALLLLALAMSGRARADESKPASGAADRATPKSDVAPVTTKEAPAAHPSTEVIAASELNQDAIKLGLNAWINRQPGALADALTTPVALNDGAGAKARADKLKGVLNAEYLTHLKEQLEEIKNGDANETRTTASLIFVPELRVAQPAIIQSFSLRNLFHPFMDTADELRTKTRQTLLRQGLIRLTPAGAAAAVEYDIGLLTDDQLTTLAQAIVEQQLKINDADRSFYAKFAHWLADAISLDVGITSSSTSFGDKGATYAAKVDKDFPQFLFGLGLHLEPAEASVGVELYRTPAGKFKTSVYFGLSVQIFSTHFNLHATN